MTPEQRAALCRVANLARYCSSEAGVNPSLSLALFDRLTQAVTDCHALGLEPFPFCLDSLALARLGPWTRALSLANLDGLAELALARVLADSPPEGSPDGNPAR